MANGGTVKAPEDRAIVVGVNEYDANEGIRWLGGCVNDARMFKEWLIDPAGGGLDPAKVNYKVSPGGGTLTPIKDEIEEVMRLLYKEAISSRNGRVGRRLYLWFSGHGVTPKSDDKDCALLMANASLEALGRAIPGRKAARLFHERAMFDEVVLFMDCCREVPDSTDAVLLLTLSSPDPTVGQNVRYLYGFASEWGKPAVEKTLPHPLDSNQPALPHGIFTHAVLEGLHHAVDIASGQVTSESLPGYVKKKVSDLLGQGGKQEPTFECKGPIIFGTGTRIPVWVTLTDASPAPPPGFVVLSGNPFKPVPIQPQPDNSGGYRIDLAPAMYLFCIPDGAGGYVRAMPKTILPGEEHHVQL